MGRPQRADATRTFSYLDYRLTAIRFGIVASWLAVGALAFWEFRMAAVPKRDLVVLVGAALVVFSLTPWRRILEHRMADILLALGSVTALLALAIIELDRPDPPIAVGFLVVVLFAAATVTWNLLVSVVTLLAFAAYAYSTVSVSTVTPGGAAVLLGSFGAACVLVLVMTGAIRSRLTAASEELVRLAVRERELARQEEELSNLYEISRTIGAGTNLAEVLPELVGRMARAVGAAVGVVALYRPASEALEVVSPIWVRDHVIPNDAVELPLTSESVLVAAFIAAETRCVEGEDLEDDPLLGSLEVERAIVTPLRVGGRRIGVVVLADMEDPPRAEDVERVRSMAGPAALVLDHLARYEEVSTEGAKMAELAELKSEFVSVVSHELRTPLTSIIGVLGTLQRPELAPADPTARELVDTAAAQAERLRILIEDLLVASRLESEGLPIRIQTLAAHNFLEDVVESVPGARRRTTLVIAPDVTRIDADPEHLSRILRNLLENALKYAGNSPIELGARLEPGALVLFVRDHGPGIPWADRERIFERFTQLQPHDTRWQGGTGLGLHIVRGLTEMMGGEVWFEPTVGGGATFVVRLPRRGVIPSGPMATAWSPPST